MIGYIEGEFTWIAKRGERVHVVEAIDPPFMFSYEESERELEYSMSEYMPAEDVHAAFAIDPPDRPEGVHPAEPFTPPSLWQAFSRIGPIFAAVAILGLFAVLVLGGGREIVRSAIDDPSSTAWTVPFSVADAGRLLKIELISPVRNNWVYYDIAITDPESDEVVLTLGQEVSFYEGRDSDGYWSEGSRQAEALFKVPAPGDYQVQILASEAGGQIPRVELRLYDRIMVKRYAVMLLVLSILASLALPFAHYRFEKKRWADVLKDDDDD